MGDRHAAVSGNSTLQTPCRAGVEIACCPTRLQRSRSPRRCAAQKRRNSHEPCARRHVMLPRAHARCARRSPLHVSSLSLTRHPACSDGWHPERRTCPNTRGKRARCPLCTLSEKRAVRSGAMLHSYPHHFRAPRRLRRAAPTDLLQKLAQLQQRLGRISYSGNGSSAVHGQRLRRMEVRLYTVEGVAAVSARRQEDSW